MPTLRLTQSVIGENRFHVEAALEEDGLTQQTFTSDFEYRFSEQDREDIRCYLEDYLQYSADPSPLFAARVEQRIAEIGVDLFNAVFQTGDSRYFWAKLRERLSNTRVEITTSVQEAALLPWEMLRDPKSDSPVALSVDAFVRTSHQVPQRLSVPQTGSGPIRILLVISHPAGSDDVPFRSVASRLIKGLTDTARQAFRFDVLRPPTVERLRSILRDARAKGDPYHVVHFDGHGAYRDTSESISSRQARGSHTLSAVKAGAYLVFENPAVEENFDLVDASMLGVLLAETQVPVLIINACHSANLSEKTSDAQLRVRAFESLAHEALELGIAGVVGMQYDVDVVRAARFVADVYASLADGLTLGEAVTTGRKQMALQLEREVAYEMRVLQDWIVPIMYESAPVALFSKSDIGTELKLAVSADASVPSFGIVPPELQKTPESGFFGGDETLLALDRAFDTHQVVLLHGYAGSGKTSTAAEFARWYSATHGVDGPVLFTSFEQYKALPQVLNETIGRVFEAALEQTGVPWLTLSDEQRRDVALQIMSQIPVLWIWDNVEPIGGFPTGNESIWSVKQQRELADLLRSSQRTKAKFLLTSRRNERDWLGDLPRCINMPPMPMPERAQLARAIAEQHGSGSFEVKDWLPLLEYTGGNPLTITVLVRQALRHGVRTREQSEAFVVQLRTEETAFEDSSQVREASLEASLKYGFENAFDDTERRRLALLHLFQGFVDVDVFRVMGEPDADWCLPELRGFTREEGISLFDRAADSGLLTIYGDGYYSIHPALPWFFKSFFDQYYPPAATDDKPSLMKAVFAFTSAMSSLGTYYHREYGQGRRTVIDPLSAEEGNLLQAYRFASRYQWWSLIISSMQGLRALYSHTGRRAEWARLVEEVVPLFIDPATDGPLPGREAEWTVVTQYRVYLAIEGRQWEKAERLQRVQVEWERERVASVLLRRIEDLRPSERNDIRTMAVCLDHLGLVLREQGDKQCQAAYQEAIDLYRRLDDKSGEAAATYNLGVAHKDLPQMRDLARAEEEFRRSLELRDERDILGRSKCLVGLGSIAYERFLEADAESLTASERSNKLNESLRFANEALSLIPSNAPYDLAVTQNNLGLMYARLGEWENAWSNYREAIQRFEMIGDLYSAAQTRYNVALGLTRAGRFQDAMDYARAALGAFSNVRAAGESLQKTEKLVQKIQDSLVHDEGVRR